MKLISFEYFHLNPISDVRDPFWGHMAGEDLRDVSDTTEIVEAVEAYVEGPVITVIVDEVRQDIVAFMEDGEPID